MFGVASEGWSSWAAIQGWRRTGGKKLGQEIDWERGGGGGEPLAPERGRRGNN